MIKKIGGRKSRWTVPLMPSGSDVFFIFHCLNIFLTEIKQTRKSRKT